MLALQAKKLTIGATIDGAVVPAIRDLSFDLAAGKILGLVGESGAGKTMVGLGVIISFLVVLLNMHTMVMERTREIGILKALGASRWFILKVILAEAVVMGLGGTVVGIGLSFVARALIQALYPASLTQAITPDWWPKVAVISLVGVLLGALYPGLSAAAQDPIEALAYE